MRFNYRHLKKTVNIAAAVTAVAHQIIPSRIQITRLDMLRYSLQDGLKMYRGHPLSISETQGIHTKELKVIQKMATEIFCCTTGSQDGSPKLHATKKLTKSHHMQM